MDYKNYLQKKEKGTAEIITAGGGFAYATKKFNAETGELMPPEIESLDKDKLIAEREQLVSSIADIDSILAEIESLKPQDYELI